MCVCIFFLPMLACIMLTSGHFRFTVIQLSLYFQLFFYHFEKVFVVVVVFYLFIYYYYYFTLQYLAEELYSCSHEVRVEGQLTALFMASGLSLKNAKIQLGENNGLGDTQCYYRLKSKKNDSLISY